VKQEIKILGLKEVRTADEEIRAGDLVKRSQRRPCPAVSVNRRKKPGLRSNWMKGGAVTAKLRRHTGRVLRRAMRTLLPQRSSRRDMNIYRKKRLPKKVCTEDGRDLHHTRKAAAVSEELGKLRIKTIVRQQ
jgi:hypothetical protein